MIPLCWILCFFYVKDNSYGDVDERVRRESVHYLDLGVRGCRMYRFGYFVDVNVQE